MQNSDLIQQLKNLKSIQPSEDWILNNREKMNNQIPEDFWQMPAWSMAVLSFVLILGTAGLSLFAVSSAQNSLPGDVLHPLKIVSEKAQTVFVKQDEKTELEVKFVSNRIEELNKVLDKTQEQNQTNEKKIAAVKEVDQKVKEYKRELEHVKEELPKQEQAEVEPAIDNALDQAAETSSQALEIVASINRDKNDLNSPELSSEEIIAKIEIDLEALETELGADAAKAAREYFNNRDYVLALEELTNLEKDVIIIEKELKESREFIPSLRDENVAD